MTTLPWGRPLTREDLDRVPWIGTDVELVDGSAVLTRERAPFTSEDRERLPEDGRRHELIGGALVMTPAPAPRHQFVSGNLFRVLDRACPDALAVLYAPVDVILAAGTVVEPDLLVAPRAAFSATNLPVPPLLAVEVLSPSTRRLDLGRKRDAYEQARVAAYWVIDPDNGEFIAWQFEDGCFAEVARIGPGDAWSAEVPFPVTVRPADLIEPGTI
ncbi:Uma2 family endonuclease [Nocardioides sp. AE5]|uniref:Uma2 family endonuclease n=1 Tax=Nocardioides sp. AE5 TaxID=2962573 RepID=UPI002880E00C|nr:Uma2 family endonuclease [Nocardioides sp. AE5]MDT0202191.1 Uma2 family endonuclease [Nocardioides sp. AE5]